MNSQEIFSKACELMPGGVNSPVRAYRAVGMTPPFIERAEESHIFDVDGNKYVDYVGSWGPMILGHAREEVVRAVTTAAVRGTSFGAPTNGEVELAEMIRNAVPSMEMMRMVNSGTEAVMSAIRAARGYTGRDYIVKFEGCYHGHADHLLIKAGSGALTLGVPSTPGVPEGIAGDTINAKYNDLASVEAIFAEMGNEIAAIIVEPIAGNMGLVLPEKGFLEGLREITSRYGALLIFDEVISGFRASIGGAQGYYGITPDLTCLGKIIGGGLPVGAYGGKKEIMNMVAPAGPVYQAGTLSGNPLAMAAGLAALNELTDESIYQNLAAKGAALAEGLRQAAAEAGVKVTVNNFGSLLTVFFTEGKVTSYPEAAASNTAQFKAFYQSMLNQGFYLPPSQFECWFISNAHTDEDIKKTIEAAKVAFGQAKLS